jgi:hypothetical protein
MLNTSAISLRQQFLFAVGQSIGRLSLTKMAMAILSLASSVKRTAQSSSLRLGVLPASWRAPFVKGPSAVRGYVTDSLNGMGSVTPYGIVYAN